MVAIGFGWLASALTDSRSDVVFTLGLCSSNLWPGLLIHLLLSYPSGRLDRRSRIDRHSPATPTRWASRSSCCRSPSRARDGQGASPHSAVEPAARLAPARPDRTSSRRSRPPSRWSSSRRRWWSSGSAGGRRRPPRGGCSRRCTLTGAAAIGVLLLVVTGAPVAGVAGTWSPSTRSASRSPPSRSATCSASCAPGSTAAARCRRCSRPCATSARRAGCATRCGSRSTTRPSSSPTGGRGATSTWT